MNSVLAHARAAAQALNNRKKEAFWLWIGYQTVKGLTTTALIWVPLAIAFFGTGK